MAQPLFPHSGAAMETRLGVALILFRDEGYEEVFFVREKKSKPEIAKVKGQLSVPMETVEPGETPITAVQRLIIEEVGVPTTHLTYLGCAHGVLGPGATIRCDISVYIAVMTVGDQQHPTDPDDIDIVGWRPVSWLRSLGAAGRHELPHIAALLGQKT